MGEEEKKKKKWSGQLKKWRERKERENEMKRQTNECNENRVDEESWSIVTVDGTATVTNMIKWFEMKCSVGT